MARSIPGAFWSKEDGAWVVIDPVPRAAAVILRLFPDLAIAYPWLQDLRDELLQDVRPFDNATPLDIAVDCEQVRDQLAGEGFDLYRFQEIDLGYICAVLEQHGGAYIGWERGLGKTLATAAVVDELGLKKVLVVCPNTAKESVWASELARFLPSHNVVAIRNTKNQRDRDLSHAYELIQAGRPTVLVVHYESLAIIDDTKRTAVTWRRFGDWELIAADEAHRLANPKAGFVRALKRLRTERKLALSGSIIQNHAEELFSPLQWLFPARYRSKWRDWNDRYLDYVENGYSRICIGVKPDCIEDMRQELGVFMVYRRKEDELDLPPKVEQTMLVDLSPPQRKAYDDLVTSCLTQLDDGTVIKAAEGLVLLTRLRQIASGLDALAENVTDSSKGDVALELIQDNVDEAFIVFTWYRANAIAIADRLERAGVGTFLVHGGVGHKKRAEYIERFQSGEGRVFVGTLATLSESVNLQRASQVVFIDRHWNPATNVQGQDRAYRMGQTKPVTITHLVARHTVDEYRVLPALANKEAIRRAILGGI